MNYDPLDPIGPLALLPDALIGLFLPLLDVYTHAVGSAAYTLSSLGGFPF